MLSVADPPQKVETAVLFWGEGPVFTKIKSEASPQDIRGFGECCVKGVEELFA
jgi:hypothetical protein